MQTPQTPQPNADAQTRTAVVLDDGSAAVQATRDLLAKQAYATTFMAADTPVDSVSSVEALCELLRHALNFAQQEGARLVALPMTAEAAVLKLAPVHDLFGALHGVVESARQAGLVEDMLLAAPFVNETAAAVASLASAADSAAKVASAVSAASKAVRGKG